MDWHLGRGYGILLFGLAWRADWDRTDKPSKSELLRIKWAIYCLAIYRGLFHSRFMKGSLWSTVWIRNDSDAVKGLLEEFSGSEQMQLASVHYHQWPKIATDTFNYRTWNSCNYEASVTGDPLTRDCCSVQLYLHCTILARPQLSSEDA